MSRAKSKQKPHPARQCQLAITSLSNSGDGVARVDNKVVFVPFGVPGDQLLVEFTEEKKSFSKARILEIIEPSPHRQDPPCEFFGSCGGCDWQNISYEYQLEWKKRNLLDVLQRIGNIEDLTIVEDVVPSPKSLHYRNRIQVNKDKQGLYFNQKRSHHPVHIDKCLIASERINASFNEAKVQNCSKMEIAETDQGVGFFEIDSKGNSPLGFRQVNWEQNQFLIRKCLNVLESNQLNSLVDLYCGQGNWSIEIKKAIPSLQCTGIEINPINIKAAKLFETQGLKFMEGDVEKIYPQIGFKPDAVIIDPPRAGCSPELIETVNKNKPSFLIYISCHPATLARDVKEFCQNGWTLSEIIPVDMFPQTAHLETWCLLRSET